jgi:hypothetical protein
MIFKNKICVLTPSIRPEGLKIVQKALEEQEFEDFDWYIGSPKEPCNVWGTWVEDDFKGGDWTLNRIYNKLIRHSQGELIVSWQDFTYGDKNILSTLWERYQNDKKSLVSVAGNKYIDDTFMLESWFDPRISNNPFRQTGFNEVEWNLCSCPRKALEEVGGFVECLDYRGFGMDGYCVNERLDELGYRFFVDSTIRTYSLMHGRVSDWEEKNLIHKWNETKEQLKKEGKWKHNYLSK